MKELLSAFADQVQAEVSAGELISTSTGDINSRGVKRLVTQLVANAKAKGLTGPLQDLILQEFEQVWAAKIVPFNFPIIPDFAEPLLKSLLHGVIVAAIKNLIPV